MLNKILVVDDSAALHQIYQITLARYKCTVLTAINGQEGLNLLAKNPGTNLLIVDMHMQPHMSGVDFILGVKGQEAFNKIPIIAVIQKNKEKEDRQEALHLAEGILKKPFTSKEIHLEVERLFPESSIKSKT